MSTQVFAGSLEPPAGPDSTNSAMYSLEAIYQRLLTGTNIARRGVGFSEPTSPPGTSTMHNLNEIMGVAPSNDNVNGVTTEKVPTGQTFWGLTTNEWGTQTGAGTKTLSDSTNAVDAGYYAATNLSEVDTDLDSTNIIVNVTIFGATGTYCECLVPKTGQTSSYGTNDDGFLQKGEAWPVPRFTDNGDGTITDNMTEFIWTKNANIWGSTNWCVALTNCNELCQGTAGAGLTDGSQPGDWRLPNVNELRSLIDFGRTAPALPSGHPFTGVQLTDYWTGTTYVLATSKAWTMLVNYGEINACTKSLVYNIWPVRGGL